MHAVIVKACGECPFYRDNEYGQDWCGHPRADVHVDVDGPDLPAKCPLRRWSVLVQAAEAPSAREHEPKQSIDVEPPREPLVTQEERDAAMAKALSCLVEDLAQWREERPTEGRERACCDLHSAKEEG